MAGIAGSTGSAVRQSRLRGGHGREKSGASSQTPRDPSDFAMHPYPGGCRRPCFMVRISCREAKSVQYTAERLEQNLVNHRGSGKKHAVTSSNLAQPFHSSRQNPQAPEKQVISTQKLAFTKCEKVQNSRLCVSRDKGCHIPQTDELLVVRNSHTTARNNKL